MAGIGGKDLQSQTQQRLICGKTKPAHQAELFKSLNSRVDTILVC